jgi:hypothetical protein
LDSAIHHRVLSSTPLCVAKDSVPVSGHYAMWCRPDASAASTSKAARGAWLKSARWPSAYGVVVLKSSS